MAGKSCDLKKMISFSEGGIVSKVVAKGKKSETTLFCMAKDTALSEHTSGREAIVLVLEGKGSFDLSGRKTALEPGVFISMPAGTKHALKARENLAFLLLTCA